MPLALIAVAFVASLLLSSTVDLLSLGDAMATHLGVRVRAVRLASMLLASAAAAAAVSFAGLLGFVGLMAPHISARFVGGKLRHRIPAAVLCGAFLVVGADFIGRLAFAPGEMPVGVLMSLLGAPFFLFLLLRKGEEKHA